jgi:type I restriction enzyme S subunit
MMSATLAQNTELPIVALEEIMRGRGETVDPADHPAEEFDLYSIPAYDLGVPELLSGSKIGSTKQMVEPGDVLLSKIVPHIRRTWVVGPSRGRRIIASSEWIVFRDSRVLPSYLRHLLVEDGFHAKFMQTVSGVGGSLLRARPSFVAQITIPLPSLLEQRRIADVLDRAESLRTKRRAALAEVDLLPQSLFLDLFGHQAVVLQRWPTRKLGDLLDFLTSGSRGWAKYYAHSGDLFLRIQNVRRDELVIEDVAYVNAPNTAEAQRTRVRPGDVLLSITADLGRTAVVPNGIGTAFINQHLSILRTSKINPRFLSAYFASPAGQRQVLGRNRQAVKAGLNFDDIRSFEVPEPPIELQNEFVRRVVAVEKLKAYQCASLAELDALFTSLQHRAFRGAL